MGVHRRRGLRGDRVRRAAPRGRRLNAGASEGGAPPADLARARLLCLAAPVVLSLVWVPAAYPSWALGSCLLLLLGAATLAADGAAPRRGALALAILSTAWCVAGLAWAPVPANGLEAASGAVQFALAFGLALSLADAGRGRFAAGGALFIGALAVWGAYQAVGPAGWPRTYATLAARLASEMDPSDPLLGSLAHTLSERRAAGTLGSPNVFASICAAGALLAAGCWAGAARTGRAALAAACAACLAGLWLSGSRGGVLGFLAGAVVFAALLGGGRLARTGAAAALVALLAASCGPSSDASRWLGSTTVAQRAAYWRTGAELARAHPLRGLGAGGYATLYHTRRIAGANETKFAHNWLVQRAVDQGAVGALLFAGAAAWALGAGARRLRG
ncbi:MAG: O-antigen ligase family protein, partial [Candidatus Sumerlaeia bacterium]|nr:O-antigen ligase family protein [Candidatus Sumerlaeia bacterium]